MIPALLNPILFCERGARSSALLQACEGGGRSRHADWGPKEQFNFSSLLPVTYPKWQSAVRRETQREEGRGEREKK